MPGWHHRLDGREFEWTLAVGDGQGGLACCSSWGCKESDTTEQLNWTELSSVIGVCWLSKSSFSKTLLFTWLLWGLTTLLARCSANCPISKGSFINFQVPALSGSPNSDSSFSVFPPIFLLKSPKFDEGEDSLGSDLGPSLTHYHSALGLSGAPPRTDGSQSMLQPRPFPPMPDSWTQLVTDKFFLGLLQAPQIQHTPNWIHYLSAQTFSSSVSCLLLKNPTGKSSFFLPPPTWEPNGHQVLFL